MKRSLLYQLSVVLSASCLSTVSLAADVDWPHYGSDLRASKYTPIDQIDADNVSTLALAWRWASPDNAMVADNHAAGNMAATPGAYKVTPIAVDGVLYLSTSMGQVAAIDGVSGEQIWVFDTDSSSMGRPANLGYNHRGVSYWHDGETARIIMTTNDAMLWLLDAATGEPVQDFGDNGRVDLTVGLGREVERRAYSQIAAPLVIDDLVIIGSSIHDVPMYMTAPPGHVRAFDLRTGEQVWRFNTIPQAGEYGNETWGDDSWQYSGGSNVWTMMSADEELGLVYLPTGTPTNDWYGGHRPGDNLFAESLIAVDARSGERVWHYQFVRHGLWDYDLPAAPNLIDITVDGREIKAIAQITKQAFVFVFDRETGEPVWPIEDRPVPQSIVPGEQSAATQPHPTWPLPFDLQGLSEDDLIDFSPELRSEALEIVARFDYGPLFTPPSLRGTINIPGWMGGANWHGAAVDPETGIMYLPSMTSPVVAQLVEPEPGTSDFDYIRGGVRSIVGPRGLPLTRPPYGRIVAIDMNSGEHLWTIAHGDGPRQRLIDMGMEDPGPLGAAAHTGPVLTPTLLFIAQQDGRRSVLRAYDKLDGSVVHEIDLPGVPGGTPMSYQIDGKQYIALTIGGGLDAEVLTYALP
jgi:quinoprotein glucose dehydrogenase